MALLFCCAAEREKESQEASPSHDHSEVLSAPSEKVAVGSSLGSNARCSRRANRVHARFFPCAKRRIASAQSDILKAQVKLCQGLSPLVPSSSSTCDAELWDEATFAKEKAKQGKLLASIPEYNKKYGRFKYCGLRPDPVSFPATPPQYRTRDAQLPLPRMQHEERENLLQLSRNLSDLTAQGVRTDLPLLLRFLRYRNTVSEAEVFFRKGVQWQKENDVERSLTHWDLELYEDWLAPWWPCGGALGHGRNGEPVVLERIGRADAKWLMNLPDLINGFGVKVDIVHCLRTVAAFEEDAIRRNVPFEGAILIMDMDGLTWNHISMSTLRMYLKLFEGRQYMVAGCARNILIINAPAIFVQACAFIKRYLLYPETAALLEVASRAGTLELLRRYMEDSQIPAYLGGERCIDGDPECKQMIAPGGTPGTGVLERFQFLRERERRIAMTCGQNDKTM